MLYPKEILIFTLNNFSMKLVKNLFFLVFIFFLTSFGIHKFYISITQVNYAKNQKSIQITSRVFIDDLQLEINNLSNSNIELATDREPKNIDSIYNAYLNKHLRFKVNKEDVSYNYIGSEYQKDLVIFYLEIENIDSIPQIEIDNRLLIHSIKEQENIVKTNIYKKNKSFILTNNKTKALANF